MDGALLLCVVPLLVGVKFQLCPCLRTLGRSLSVESSMVYTNLVYTVGVCIYTYVSLFLLSKKGLKKMS